MLKKRLLATGTILAMTASLLGGCGNSKQDAAEATTESTEEVTVNYERGLNADGTMADITPTDYVTLCDYKNVEVSSEDVAISDDDVTSQIESVLSGYQVTDRAAVDGDTVNIDYVGMIGDEEFDDGSAEDYELTLGSDTFIDDFEDQIVGHTPGDEFNVEVTFPDDYDEEELQGQDAVFDVTLNYIVPNADTDLTDDFVTENITDDYGYTSVEDMNTTIRETLEMENQQDYILDYLVENCTYEEIPEELVDERITLIEEMLEEQAQYYGYSFEEYITAYGYDDEEALREAYYDSCEESIKIWLAVDAIAAEENLSVTEADMEEYFVNEDYNEYISYYTESYVKRSVLNYVVVKKILETASFV